MSVLGMPDALLLRHLGEGWELSVWETVPGEFTFLLQENFELAEFDLKELVGEVSLNLPQAESLYATLGAALREALDKRASRA